MIQQGEVSIEKRAVPKYDGTLRAFALRVPEVIYKASGILVFGRRIKSLVHSADIPVFAGVGGGLTQGDRVVNLATFAENQGAFGVVLNGPTANESVRRVNEAVDIPVVVTVVNDSTDYGARIAAGADIFNVSAAARTPKIVADIRRQFPDMPIIATGGPTDESILETIEAGANAITWTPPSNGEIFKDIMAAYREGLPHP